MKQNNLFEEPAFTSYDEGLQYKAENMGVSKMTSAELLALLLQSDVMAGKRILAKAGDRLSGIQRLSIADMMKIKGIGRSKAMAIAAALEFGKRRQEEIIMSKQIRSSADAADFFRARYADNNIEIMSAIFLHRNARIIKIVELSKGGIAGTVCDAQIVFKEAIDCHAAQIILCHNHPSGSLIPSTQDELLTEKIKLGGKLLDIRLMDHMIVSDSGYYSFADEGRLC